ncbi:uncharacterized protein DCS_01179 [Drechmeria coniospora]|uniref:Protein FAF1 n=1 Tax=Drechmeria coniospora TaxID=98403 RepID=A0A151GSG9_DRECN|nr:uncharacterized protein DCS_01179 [Drechmeria coniospora]KYK60045.1 uncharacterized protein DCS_01179 [Drechmeria coniospora]ODA79987.1 hypothetical protein RJ55_02945 [Drechmeria coniospora]
MTVLGKRKAPEPSISHEDANEIFRRHFESRFAPIDVADVAKPRNEARKDPKADDDDEDDEDEDGDGDDDSNEEESAWGGLSDDEISDDADDMSTVEVIDHSNSKTLPATSSMSKRERKAFMSSRPPDQSKADGASSTPSSGTSTPSSLPEDAPSLLAQDLELRRLIAESHLLSGRKSPLTSLGTNQVAPKSFASGRIRQKALDLRVQALGSSLSIHKQEKMPMKMRKGMVAATDAREAKRRREARENGVILERETAKNKGRDRARDRGAVDRPGVGRLKGAELRLSSRDVRGLEGVADKRVRRKGTR